MDGHPNGTNPSIFLVAATWKIQGVLVLRCTENGLNVTNGRGIAGACNGRSRHAYCKLAVLARVASVRFSLFFFVETYRLTNINYLKKGFLIHRFPSYYTSMLGHSYNTYIFISYTTYNYNTYRCIL